MKTYSRACAALARVLVWANLLGLVVIVVGLTLQVFTRYVLNNPMHSTDEITQNTLTWMAFLGAAFLYRERAHIEVDYFVARMPRPAAAVIATVVELAILASLCLLLYQIFAMAGTMSRVVYGTLSISKFTLQFVPALISCVCTVLFSLEHIVAIWRDPRDPGLGLRV